LSKGVILELYKRIIALYIANLFIRNFYRRYGLSRAIISDYSMQFIRNLWKRVYELLGIVRRLSTAFYPKIDRVTERINQNMESFVRFYIDYMQKK
jgi:hypothetical protein